MEILPIMKRIFGFLPIGGSTDPAAGSIFAKIVLNRKKCSLDVFGSMLCLSLTRNFGFSYRPHGNVDDNEAFFRIPRAAILVFHIGHMEMLPIMKRFSGFLPIGGSIDPAADSIFAKIVLNRKKMVFVRIWLNVGPLPDPQFRFFI